MRYLLVGGNGYLGSELSQQLSSRGHEVTVASRSTPKDLVNRSFVRWDASKEWEGSPPPVDVVVHLATSNGDSSLHSLDDFLANVAVTRNIVKLCSLIPNCALMYVSSIQVFGDWNGEVSQDSPVRPVSEYALCHLIAEQTVMMFARKHGRSSILLRLAHAIGRGANEDAIRWGTVPAEFCRQVVERGEIRLRTSGTQERDFIDISVACARLVKVLESPNFWDGTVHMVASGQGTSIREIAEVVSRVTIRVLGFEPTIQLGNESVREGTGSLRIRPEVWNSVVLTGSSGADQIEDSIEGLLLASIERWGGRNSASPR